MNNSFYIRAGGILAAISVHVIFVVIPRTGARMSRLVRTEGVVEGHAWEGLSKAASYPAKAPGLPGISYRDTTGQTREATVRIGQARNTSGPIAGPDLSSGARVAIRYDPQQPDCVMVEGLPDPVRDYWGLAGVTGVMGFCVLLMALL